MPRTRRANSTEITEEPEAAPETDGGESAVPQATYRGLPIVKRTLDIGKGGTIDLPGELLEAVPRSRVRFEAEADLGSVKHSFPSASTVAEQVVLTIDASSLVILAVEDPPPVPEQTSIDSALEDELGETASAPALEEG